MGSGELEVGVLENLSFDFEPRGGGSARWAKNAHLLLQNIQRERLTVAFSAPLGVVERDDALDQSADSRRNPTVRSRENGVGVWCVRPIIKIHEQKVLFDWTMALTQNTGPLSVWRKTSVRVCQRRNTGPANSVVRTCEHRKQGFRV